LNQEAGRWDYFRIADKPANSLKQIPVRVSGLRLGVRICYSGVRKRTAQANLSHIKSFTMWLLVLAIVMLIPLLGG